MNSLLKHRFGNEKVFFIRRLRVLSTGSRKDAENDKDMTKDYRIPGSVTASEAMECEVMVFDDFVTVALMVL